MKRRITQEQLADSLGYHLSYIGLLERGQKSPTLRTIFNVAEMFGISAGSLVALVERKRKSTRATS